jgi:putative FmdB family regulatory protein
MPIYDYRCRGCQRRISLLFQTYAAAEHAACPHCGSTDLSRLVTRFAVMRSEDTILDDLSEAAAFGEVDENDPRSIARWARKMGHAYGDELGEDYGEMVDRMEAGELDDEAGGEGGEFADAPFD